MPPGRKPKPKILVAKSWSGAKPTPIIGPIARRLQSEAEAKELDARVAAALKAAASNR